MMMYIVNVHYNAHQIHQDIKVIQQQHVNVYNIVKLVFMHWIQIDHV